MDETLTVYANPPATTEDCINIPFDKSKGFSSILCGVYNNPTDSAQTNNTLYPDNVVPIHTGAQEQAAHTQRMITEAQFASLKATAAESARLDAQQQQVRRLIEGQQFTLNHMKVESERNRNLQLDLQNKLQLSFTKQRQHSDAAIARSIQNTQANFKGQMAKTMASMRIAAAQTGAAKAWERANKLAEQQKQEHERQLQQEMAKIAEAQNNLMAEQCRLQEEIARRNEEHNRLVAEQHRQAEEARQRATSLALEQKHQQETQHHHAQDRQLRAGISQDRRQKIDNFMQEMKDEIACIKNEHNQTISKYNNANKSKEDRNRCSEAKLNYANKTIELAERLKSRAEEMMRETQNWISGLDSHFPMIHSHFDHQIKNINPILDHATRIHLEAHWNGLRQIQINDKHHDIKIAQNEYNIIAHTLTDRNYNITEGRIIKQIAESELTHTGNELRRENEALDRMNSYKISLADAKKNAELLISSENNYDSVISSIDSLKNKAESWLQQADDRIKMRNTHPPLINAHYDANINRTLSMALPTSSKQLLEKEWNNQRNLELDYKKGQINASIQEYKFIKEIIQARNIQLDEVKQIAARVALASKLSFLSITQQSQKSQEKVASDTLASQVGTNVKWTAIEASQALAFAGGMAAGVPAELHDVVRGIVEMGKHPLETAAALKALATSGNVLGNVSEAIKDKWVAHIDNMVAAQERGELAGYFEAGVEGGKLVTDVASLGLAGVGAAKVGKVAINAGAAAGAVKNIPVKAAPKPLGYVNSAIHDTTISSYGPHQMGPLGNPNDLKSPASTFRSGTYLEKTANKDIYFYRDHGGSAKVNGRYWTLEPSKGPLQSQLDSAVLPEWGNTFENQSVMKVPTGTVYYEGYAAGQTGSEGLHATLHGGGKQVYLPTVKNEWIIKK
ncbi:hypothetical protein ACL2XP_20610 [Sodalis sp. RH21]|uniref:hypothetical protein n=1 Tax=unclassified Sodalis (in: enterobacteria) TaxID=2636512 RepID=UPI0039B40504